MVVAAVVKLQYELVEESMEAVRFIYRCQHVDSLINWLSLSRLQQLQRLQQPMEFLGYYYYYSLGFD